MEFNCFRTLYHENIIKAEKLHVIAVKLTVIWSRRIDMENMDMLKFNNFVNHNYYVKNILQGRMNGVHVDEFDTVTLKNFDLKMSRPLLIENKHSVFFLHFRVVCENNSKQSAWIYDNIYNVSEIEVHTNIRISFLCEQDFRI